MIDLIRVVVADHVIGKDDETLSRQIDPDGDQIATPLSRRGWRRRGRRHVHLHLQTPVRPMAVRIDDAREGTFLAFRTIEVAAQIEPGKSLYRDVLNRVVRPFDPAGNAR